MIFMLEYVNFYIPNDNVIDNFLIFNMTLANWHEGAPTTTLLNTLRECSRFDMRTLNSCSLLLPDLRISVPSPSSFMILQRLH